VAGPSPAMRVALTFDAEHPDRPTDGGAEARLLATLDDLAVPATFFVQGRWAEAFPDRARRIADDGHLIGNHGHYHVRLPLLTAAGLEMDVADAERAIVEATGRDPKPWFRCPFGAGMADPPILAALGRAGYRHVGWDVDVMDWESGMTPAHVAEVVVSGVLGRRAAGALDSIVLLHSWPAATGAGVEIAAARLRDAEAELVRVDQLVPA
jgi:peptidoglycan-N-acetylglucosamine deacetylase